jgi:LEA14-like dessication related protein
MKKWAFPTLVIALFFTACSKPIPPEFIGVEQFKVINMGLAESTLGLEVKMYNPNKTRMQLKDADIDIFINEMKLGNSVLDSTIDIPRQDTFMIPIQVKVKTLSGATKLIQSLSDSAVNFKVSGNAKLGKAGVFVNYPLLYEGRQLIK